MRVTRVIVGGHHYDVHPDEDADRVRSKAFEAAAAGVGLFNFAVVDGRRVHILLSPGVPLIFEDVSVAEAPREGELVGASGRSERAG